MFPVFCRHFPFLVRSQAIAKEFTVSSLGWAVGSRISHRIFPELFKPFSDCLLPQRMILLSTDRGVKTIYMNSLNFSLAGSH